MKLLLVPFLFFSIITSAQNNVGIKSDGSLPDSSAKLDIQSTTQGLLLPRMTTSQRNAMPKKAPGLIVYDTDKQTLYLYNGSQWNPLAAVTNAELQAFSTAALPGSDYESFGCSVAISGDWAAVGAYGYDLPGKPDCGAVYLFNRINGAWQQVQIITASDAEASGRFGFSVALDGDRLIAGAYLATIGANTYAGAAYIFHRISNNWTEQIKLQASDPSAGDYFGWSVAIEGNSAIVGAPGDDGAGTTDEGSAYIYRYESFIPGWVFDKKILGTLPASNDKFGKSVSISGNYALVGVPGRSSNAGIALIFEKTSNWLSVTAINQFVAANSQFGASVFIKNATIVIGSPNETVNGLVGRGKVYSFYYYFGWQYNGDILLPSLQAGDQFGSAVSFANGYLIAGAPGRTVNGNAGQGEAYLFKQIGVQPSTVSWEYKRKINVNNGSMNDQWGQNVSVNGFNLVTGTEWPQNARGKVIFLNIED